MLKSIELVGFKSFAKKGLLSFESPITAIVGPNGSGKSNTAEAFRFVLGEQGSKAMRIKKGTDLIWGGSHTLPRGSRAGVRIVLDNREHKLKVDFDEVVIERSVLRDGTNEYSVNGARVRLKDVQDLLSGAHVGSSGHHIISQGQADRVLGASPRERKEMLEDALGLKVYQLKKSEALSKLKTTAHNLEKAESRQRELAPNLKYLQRQVERVQQAQEIKKELRVQACTYFASEREWVDAKKAAVQSELPTVQRTHQTLTEQVQQLQQKIQETKEDTSLSEGGSESEAVLQHKRTLITMRSTIASLRTELGKVTGQLDMLTVVEQKARTLPSSIAHTEVRELLTRVLETLEEGGVEQVKILINSFMQEHLTVQQEQVSDTAIVQERASLVKVQQELAEQVAGQEQAVTQQEQVVAQAQQEVQQNVHKETEYERDLYKATAQLSEAKAHLADLQRIQAEVEGREQALAENIGEVQILLGEELTLSGLGSSMQQSVPTRRDIERLKMRLEQYGALGADVLAEYAEAQEQHNFLTQEINDLQAASSALASLMSELDTRMQAQFAQGFALVSREFATFFKTLFDGGSAELVLVEEGVGVQVHLPRKKVTTLETLSGGERALASIALIFAMSQVNPPPFIILDETDAALDEANSSRYASLVQQLAQRSQIILITHNRATMAAAHTLYGVTMGSDGVSKLLSVRLTEAQQYAK